MRLSRFATAVDLAAAPLPEWIPAARRRRLDSFARSACAAVAGVVGAAPRLDPDTALVVSTSYGAVDSTMHFLDSMAEFGDRAASPTPFTSSVHSSCAGALGELLGLHGPCATISQGGLGTLAALRWARLILTAGRAPAVLVVIGDRHNAWTRDVVGQLVRCRWPIGDGMVACLIEDGDGAGRELRWNAAHARRCLDGGAITTAGDEVRLHALADGQQRLIAPDVLGRWWPCCTLAALSDAQWRDGESLVVRECDNEQMEEVWLGPWA